MNNNCLNILKWTEAQLKYTYDVSLQEATPQELHEALGQAVMMPFPTIGAIPRRPVCPIARPTTSPPST